MANKTSSRSAAKNSRRLVRTSKKKGALRQSRSRRSAPNAVSKRAAAPKNRASRATTPAAGRKPAAKRGSPAKTSKTSLTQLRSRARHLFADIKIAVKKNHNEVADAGDTMESSDSAKAKSRGR